MKNCPIPLIGLISLIITGNLYLNAQNCTEISVVVTSGARDDEIGWNIAQDNGWATASGVLGTVNACSKLF